MWRKVVVGFALWGREEGWWREWKRAADKWASIFAIRTSSFCFRSMQPLLKLRKQGLYVIREDAHRLNVQCKRPFHSTKSYTVQRRIQSCQKKDPKSSAFELEHSTPTYQIPQSRSAAYLFNLLGFLGTGDDRRRAGMWATRLEFGIKWKVLGVSAPRSR